jgi:polysaccharide export outer membrane protein
MTKRSPFCGFILWLVASLPVMAAAPLPQPVAAPTDQRRLAPLGAGDTIAVQVYGQPDMSSTVYIGDDGRVSVPLVGAVPIAGLSPVEAGTRMEKALKDGQYLVDPHVTVTVITSRSQRVSVVGEVRTPGRYPLDPGASVMDLIAEAGGLTVDAADVATIVRSDAQGKTTRTPFNTRPSVDTGKVSEQSLAQAASLQNGDSIEVPRADQYYIYGEVSTPSKYRIEPNMTVIQAIARAGGVTPRGSERRVNIKRLGADGNYVTIHAKANDIVKPDDVIRVKESIF